jgi:hypothetical protein
MDLIMTSIYLDIVCAKFPKVEASIVIRKPGKTWSEGEEENHQSTKKIFASKSGDWSFSSDGVITKLKKDGIQVGSLNDFNPDAVQTGESGSGYSNETDVDFQWAVVDRAKKRQA